MFNKINNEKGIALVTALLFLAILTMLGLAALLTSSTDIQIASNEKVAAQGQYAAEAGISKMLVLLNKTSFEPTGANAPVWGVANATAEGWNRSMKWAIPSGASTFYNFSARLEYKKIDDPGRKYYHRVAFYNQSSGFPPPASAASGWPVYKITSIASNGSFQTQKNILEVTKNSYNFQVKGGLTSGAGIQMGGSARIDPNFYDATGTKLNPQPASDPSCKSSSLASAKPGIFSNSSSSGIKDQGNKGVATSANGQPQQVKNGTGIPTTPWGAMGINKNSSSIVITPDPGVYFDDIFPTSGGWPKTYAGGTPTGNNYYTNAPNYTTNIPAIVPNGKGLLIVHNPAFTPGDCLSGNWNSAVPADGCYTGKRPATLTKGTGNGDFFGLIIADAVDFQGSGTINIVGSLITLSTIDLSNWNGNLEIDYSCQAIEQNAGGKINKKLNWHKE